jgi:hypothetical protein
MTDPAPLAACSAPTAAWSRGAFATPAPRGAIRCGERIVAPTGSGKALAAFLPAVIGDEVHMPAGTRRGVQPSLKWLVERTGREVPRVGLSATLARAAALMDRHGLIGRATAEGGSERAAWSQRDFQGLVLTRPA